MGANANKDKGGAAAGSGATAVDAGFMSGPQEEADPSADSTKALDEKIPQPDPPAPESAAAAADGEVKEGKTSKKEGKGKGKEGKDPKGKEGKAKGKEGKGKEGKGKDTKGKDGAKGKGKEKAAKGAVKGSGPTAGGSGYRLNVKNLGKSTEEDLMSLFEPFGAVSMVEIKKSDKGESRGFGFVVLPGEKEGMAAVKAMNGKEVDGLKLYVAAAERRVMEDEEEGKGKGKGKSPYDAYAAQSMYAQQWAAYSQMMYYHAAMQQQSLWAKHAIATSQEYEGSLKSVSSRNGYGFIVCQQTFELFKDERGIGRDVYVDLSVLPAGAVRGSRLFFTVSGSEKKHPKAVTCRLAPQI